MNTDSTAKDSAPKEGLILIQADGLDDSSPNTNNPSSLDVIPETPDQDQEFIELNTDDTDRLLEYYRINQSKTVKVEHHIKFLKQSLKEYKTPKGLQINKEYHVIEEDEEFRKRIREIHMNAEIDIVTAMIEHYEGIFEKLCKKSHAFTKKLESKAQESPDLSTKTLNIDKPIQELKNKLQDKRSRKITSLQTHTTRTVNFVNKKKEPKRHLNYQERNNNGQSQQQQPLHPPSTHNLPPRTNAPQPRHYQMPPRNHPSQTTRRPLIADLPPRRPLLPTPPNARTAGPSTELDRHYITEVMTKTIQNMIMQMLPFFHQHHLATMNYHY